MSDSVHREKKLAYLLRHDINYAFEEHGWREVDDLVKNHGFSQVELARIVEKSTKQRFEFSEDGQYIRARQGHSINVDVELMEEIPPEYLYHGTSATLVPKIIEEGLCRMSRQYVHLSADETTAFHVGARRRCPVAILKVSACRMREDGFLFWISRNNVWLTKAVPPRYISILSTFDINEQNFLL
jgi:putative RNA 2'-phosphotransferase